MEFQYQAANAQGQLLSGEISAPSEKDALRLLRQQDLTPVSVAAVAEPGPAREGFRSRASAQDTALVVQELATLLNAGVPLAEAVESISAAHAGNVIGTAFGAALAGLRRGERFAAALRAAGLEFPAYVYQLVAAGELTGKLGPSLQTAAAQMEYEERLRQEMRNALTYPAILVVSGIAATLLVFIVVVPKFANLLKTGGANIPELSRWVIVAGLFVKDNLIWVGMGALALALGLLVAWGNASARARMFEWLSRTPLIGRWVIETEMGRWASMLGALLENRVPIVNAMELAHDGVRITSLRSRLQQALREVRAGTKLGDALAGMRALSVTGINLVRVGERSGELAPMLRTLALLYENAGRNRMKRFLLLLEPMAILLIGGVIGVIMIAIMLAVTSLSNISL